MVNLLQQSISAADEGRSKLLPRHLVWGGMSSPKVRHLLNNLMTERSRYMEIGLFTGSTFIAALYGNHPEFHVGIDNWSEWAGSRDEFWRNAKSSLTYSPNVIERDCFSINPQDITGINIYFYDGDHSEASQARALTHFYPSLADRFILIVDDYNWPRVVQGTQSSIRQLKLKVEYDRALPSRWNADMDQWWNGLYVAVCCKP